MNRLLWYVLLVAFFTPNLDANSKVRKRVQECLALAESKDAAQRKKALQDLRSLGASALPYVWPSFAHKKARVRVVVVQVVASAGVKASGLVPSLVAGMVDKDVKVREAIQSALKQIGRPHSKVLSHLVRLSRHENYNVRLEAVHALGRYEQRGVGAASAIVERLGESDRPQIASAASKALVAMGKYAVPALLKGTRSSQAKVRSGSVQALASIGEPVSKITPSLNRCLRDPVSSVKLAAIKALGKLGQFSGRNVPNLIDALKDSDSSVQIQAARALGGLGPLAGRGVSSLAKLLEHEDQVVRTAAAKALGRIGPAAAPASVVLAKRLGDVLTVRREAAVALQKIGAGSELALLIVLGHKDLEVRRSALKILVELPRLSRRAVKPLIRSLKDRDAGVRRMAVMALGRGGVESIEGLIETLNGEDVSLQRTVAGVLGQMGEIAIPAIPALSQRLMDPDHDLREASKQALRSIRKSTEDPTVHQQIDHALQSVGG